MELEMPQWGPSLNSQYIFRYLHNAVLWGFADLYKSFFIVFFFVFHKSGSANLGHL